MTLHDLDWLFVALSVLGAGIVFGTRAPLESKRQDGVAKIVAVRITAVAAMIVPGAIASHLFGTAGSWEAMFKTALALWLAPLVLAILHHMATAAHTD